MSGKKGYIVRNQRNKNQLLFLTFILRTFDKNFAQLQFETHSWFMITKLKIFRYNITLKQILSTNIITQYKSRHKKFVN